VIQYQVIKSGESELAGCVHLVTVHKGKCKGFKAMMYMNEVGDGGRSSLGEKGNVNSN